MDKQEKWYQIGGVLLWIVTIAMIVASIRFMVNALDIAMNPGLIKAPTAVTFNIDQFKQLIGAR